MTRNSHGTSPSRTGANNWMREKPRGWAQFRRMILDRDGHACQLRFRRCSGLATTVDHIVPPSLGGAWMDPANARAACNSCNAVKGTTPADHPLIIAAGTSAPSRVW